MLTGMTRAAKVFPRTTRRSYIMFWGAILLDSFRVCDNLHVFTVGVTETSLGLVLVALVDKARSCGELLHLGLDRLLLLSLSVAELRSHDN